MLVGGWEWDFWTINSMSCITGQMESYFHFHLGFPEIAGDFPLLFTTISGEQLVWGRYNLTR